jgi:hypothetical protein
MATARDRAYIRWKLAEGTVIRLLSEHRLGSPEYRAANAEAHARYEEYLAVAPGAQGTPPTDDPRDADLSELEAQVLIREPRYGTRRRPDVAAAAPKPLPTPFHLAGWRRKPDSVA